MKSDQDSFGTGSFNSVKKNISKFMTTGSYPFTRMESSRGVFSTLKQLNERNRLFPHKENINSQNKSLK